VGRDSKAPEAVDPVHDVLQGQCRGPDEQFLAECLHLVVLVDDGLAAEAVLVVDPREVPVDDLLQLAQGLQLVKEREDVHLFAARDLHAGEDGQARPLGGLDDVAGVFGGVVVADGNEVETACKRHRDDGPGVHVEVGAGREAGVDVEITAELPQHQRDPSRAAAALSPGGGPTGPCTENPETPGSARSFTTNLRVDQCIYSADDLKGRQVRHQDRDPLRLGLGRRVGGGLAALNQDDPREVLEAGHGHDVLVHLARDPDVALLAVGHDVAEQIPDIAPRDLPAEVSPGAAHLEAQFTG